MLLETLSLLSLCFGFLEGNCWDHEDLYRPLASREGDFVIAGIFDAGTVARKEEVDGEGKLRTVKYCSRENATLWGVQKMLVMRDTVLELADQHKFREINKTLGYEIYDSCHSHAVIGRISSMISNNNKVIGVSGVDYKDFAKFSAQQISSFAIPIFTYIYNDDEMMNLKEDKFPSLYSMVDTEQKEGDVIISLLKQFNYRYVDIWYHRFSKDMAMHIWDSYVNKIEHGCGRIEEVTGEEHMSHIRAKYLETGGTPSQVQLILSNSAEDTISILEHLTKELETKNKIYILGMSNGRERYLDRYTPILNNGKNQTNTLILPLATLLNAKLPALKTKLTSNWSEERDSLDRLYRELQEKHNCTAGGELCTSTSWLAYLIGGIKVLTTSLLQHIGGYTNDSCLDHLRERVFDTIVDEKKSLPVTFDSNFSANFRFVNKTVNIGYEIGVYQSWKWTDRYSILGRAFLNNSYNYINITDQELFKEISHYSQTCSESCSAGLYALHDEVMPCCWTCTACGTNAVTRGHSVHTCEHCADDEEAVENNCSKVPEVYIGPGTPYFTGGVTCASTGILLVVFFAGFIRWNSCRPAVIASDTGYLYLMLLSLSLGFGTSIIPLFEPTPLSCNVEYLSFTTFSTMTSINLAWKCYKVYEIFEAAKNLRRSVAFARTAGKIWFNITCLLLVLPLALLDVYVVGPGWQFHRVHKAHEPWYLICRLDADNARVIFSLLPLLLPTAALITTLVLAFKMRNFPHNFRETLNIFAATLIVLLCCIMFLSGYSLADNYLKSLLRSIVIFVTSLSFLLCIFLPKVFILLTKEVDIDQEKDDLNSDVRAYTLRTGMHSRSGSNLSQSGFPAVKVQISKDKLIDIPSLVEERSSERQL